MRFLVLYLSILFITGINSFAQKDGFLPGTKQVTFALLTDLHVNPGTASDSAVHRMVDEINNMETDFTIVSGDLSNTGSDAELFAVKKALDKLIKPYYVLPGNHETNWSESAGSTFNKLWGDDRFIFSSHGYMFVGFNTGPFMKMGDGIVKQEDLHWLKRELQQKMVNNEVLISFAHYPLAEGLDNWVQVTGILKSFGCRIAFCGHGHILSLLNFNGIPGIMGRSGLPGNYGHAGFNIIKLRNDSVFVYNKELSVKIAKPAIILNYLNPDNLLKLPVSQEPDFSVNQEFNNYRVVAELNDTSSIFSGPCLANDTILVYGNSLGYVKGISTVSKEIIWQIKIEGPLYSTPVAAKGKIVLGTTDGYIIGIDAISGKQLWVVKTGRPVLAEGKIEDNYVYIGGGDRNFYKIDIESGKIIWTFSGVKGLIQGQPALSGSSIVFGAWDRYLYCLDKKSGSLLWKWNNGKTQVLFSPGNISPACSGNRVFIVAPDRFMTAIDMSSGKVIWRTGIHQVRESMGESPDCKQVYVKLMNDTLIAISASAKVPSTVWAVNAGFGYEHNPCPVFASNEVVIAATRNGMLVAIDPKTSEIIWKFKAGYSSVNRVVADQTNTYWFTLAEGRVVGIRTLH